METESTSLSAGRPASRFQAAAARVASPIREEASRLSLRGWLSGRAAAGWYGRTFQPCLRLDAGGTSPESSRSSRDGRCKSPMEDGEMLESSPMRPGASAFRGECWTQDIPEFPHFRGRCRSEGVVSSLSDIVETGPAPQRCCLAANYAVAMLARAERLGYWLPPTLENVLRESASR